MLSIVYNAGVHGSYQPAAACQPAAALSPIPQACKTIIFESIPGLPLPLALMVPLFAKPNGTIQVL